jgi:hypothetical protein
MQKVIIPEYRMYARMQLHDVSVSSVIMGRNNNSVGPRRRQARSASASGQPTSCNDVFGAQFVEK